MYVCMIRTIAFKKCALQEAGRVCFHLEILVAIANAHIYVISKWSILENFLWEAHNFAWIELFDFILHRERGLLMEEIFELGGGFVSLWGIHISSIL